MKKLRTLLTLVVSLSIIMASVVVVNADTTTDLKSMTVYAVNADGDKSVVNMDFNSTTYEYELTVMSDTVSIEIKAEVADETSTWKIEKDGINTKMDFGRNFTQVSVTSISGAVNKYTLNTTKLTEEEQATYEGPENEPVAEEKNEDAARNESDVAVKVGKKEMKIASSFEENMIPEGFAKADVEYNGETYQGIKGKVKELSALYLYNDDAEGFYIYDAESNSFYAMNNIEIKSRMYTIVEPQTVDELLDNYDKKKVIIIDKEVKAWVLDEEEGMYLVYAMNWNGETSIYCYDDNEKCFQRYLASSDSNNQMEAANKAYDNLQEKYNNLVDKYNLLLKILCGLAIVIIVLIFVIINLSLNKKTKKVKSDARKSKDGMIADELMENEEDDNVNKIEDNVEKVIEEETDFDDIDVKQEQEEVVSGKFFGSNPELDRVYGDEPTFGFDEESKEGFYGGEIEDEDEIFIDISDDEPLTISPEEIDKETQKLQKETEEDLKATLKSMLPDEKDDEEDDEDFEFIDLD